MKKIIKRIACLGFSANPPHIGHLEIAKKILARRDIDEVWLIPCRKHKFKKGLWSVKHRWAMTKLMEGSGIRACDIEIKMMGISYTIDTICELQRKYPRHSFSWIIGSDIILTKSYLRWHQWSRLSRLATFLVVQRPSFPLSKKQRLPRCFKILNIKCSKNISSTMIRERMKKGLPIKRLVTPRVEKYIKNLKSKTVF